MVIRLGVVLRWVGVTALAIGLVVGAAESATAQSAASAPVGRPAEAPVGFERRPQLSPQDELHQSDAIISRMQQAATTVRWQLDAARVRRDVVKSLCLSDKLSQIEVATRSARDRKTALQAAVQRNDTELAKHEFTILTVLRQRAEQLSAEGNLCIGEEVAFVGTTQVIFTYPNLPDDTTEYPPLNPMMTEPSHGVSPFM
jgi:hypothetical protein